MSVIYNKPAEKFIKSFADMSLMRYLYYLYNHQYFIRNKELLDNSPDQVEQQAPPQQENQVSEDSQLSQIQKGSLIDFV